MKVDKLEENVLLESENYTLKKKFKDRFGIDFINKGVITHHLSYNNPEVVIFIDARDLNGDSIKDGEFIHKTIHFINRTRHKVFIDGIEKVKFYYYNFNEKNYEKKEWDDVLSIDLEFHYSDGDLSNNEY